MGIDSTLLADILKGTVGVIALFIVIFGLILSRKLRTEGEVVDQIGIRDAIIAKQDKRIEELTILVQDGQANNKQQQDLSRASLDLIESQLLGPTTTRRRSRTTRTV